MKKLFTVIAVILISITSIAQIKVVETPVSHTVGKVKAAGMLRAEISYFISSSTDTLYSFRFLDGQYQQIEEYKTIQFKGADETFSSFYSILKSFFTDENKKNKDYVKQFKLGETLITVKGMKGMMYGIMIYADKSYIVLNEKDLEKLFGKR